jgi:hypothetical protein
MTITWEEVSHFLSLSVSRQFHLSIIRPTNIIMIISISPKDIEDAGFESDGINEATRQDMTDFLMAKLNGQANLRQTCETFGLSRKENSSQIPLVTPFPSGMFTSFSNKRNGLTCFVQDASAFRSTRGGTLSLQKLYADSDDVGFAIRFESSGKVGAYKLVEIKYDEQCPEEVVSWHYAPTKHSIENVPECKQTKVIVFND